AARRPARAAARPARVPPCPSRRSRESRAPPAKLGRARMVPEPLRPFVARRVPAWAVQGRAPRRRLKPRCEAAAPTLRLRGRAADWQAPPHRPETAVMSPSTDDLTLARTRQ